MRIFLFSGKKTTSLTVK